MTVAHIQDFPAHDLLARTPNKIDVPPVYKHNQNSNSVDGELLTLGETLKALAAGQEFQEFKVVSKCVEDEYGNTVSHTREFKWVDVSRVEVFTYTEDVSHFYTHKIRLKFPETEIDNLRTEIHNCISRLIKTYPQQDGMNITRTVVESLIETLNEYSARWGVQYKYTPQLLTGLEVINSMKTTQQTG